LDDTTKERKSKKTRVTSIGEGGSTTCREIMRARGAKPRDAEEKEELAVISYKFSFWLHPDKAK